VTKAFSFFGGRGKKEVYAQRKGEKRESVVVQYVYVYTSHNRNTAKKGQKTRRKNKKTTDGHGSPERKNVGGK
jgi:hypothetical protein